MKKKRLAIVVQRYGEEVNGGAELAARWLAEQLQTWNDVQVITTCALDYTTWADYYPPGQSELNGVQIHRFPVDAPRNWRRAQKQTKRLLSQDHTLFDEVQWLKEQGPFSTPLFNFIRRQYGRFDVFIFFTYLYATTFFGLPLVSNKAILVPTAHDDPYLYLPAFRPLFHLPQAIVYLTEPEKQLVNRVTHNSALPQMVAGVGINVPDGIAPERFRQKFKIDGDFILYVGRIHESKNVPELLDYFGRFRYLHDRPLKLVLIGNSHLELPQRPDIVHLGFVSEQDKFQAIQAATLVVMPSLYESLSIIALEAWLMGVPMLVNGRCEVLRYQCRQSNGGLYYTSYDEFEAALCCLLDSSELRAQLGRQGQAFVTRHYDGNAITSQYQALLERVFNHQNSLISPRTS